MGRPYKLLVEKKRIIDVKNINNDHSAANIPPCMHPACILVGVGGELLVPSLALRCGNYRPRSSSKTDMDIQIDR